MHRSGSGGETGEDGRELNCLIRGDSGGETEEGPLYCVKTIQRALYLRGCGSFQKAPARAEKENQSGGCDREKDRRR